MHSHVNQSHCVENAIDQAHHSKVADELDVHVVSHRYPTHDNLQQHDKATPYVEKQHYSKSTCDSLKKEDKNKEWSHV